VQLESVVQAEQLVGQAEQDPVSGYIPLGQVARHLELKSSVPLQAVQRLAEPEQVRQDELQPTQV
jgi:hypothetical protein